MVLRREASTLAEVLAPLLGQQPHIFAEDLQQARERCMASLKVLVLGECGDGKSTWAVHRLAGWGFIFAESLVHGHQGCFKNYRLWCGEYPLPTAKFLISTFPIG